MWKLRNFTFYTVFQRLLETASEGMPVQGPVRSINQWIDMSQKEVFLEDGTVSKTCPAAMGYSFAAGTTDGPGEFDFTQGSNTSNPFWDFVSGLIKDPSPEQEACHAPKPILLDTGEVSYFQFLNQCVREKKDCVCMYFSFLDELSLQMAPKYY